LTVLSKFGFQHSVQRYYPEGESANNQDTLRRYYSTLFYSTALLALTLTLLFIAALLLGVGRFMGITAGGTLLLACSLVMIRSLRSMQMNLMQMENKTRLFNGMDILQKALTIGVICALLFFWQKTVFAFFLGLVIVEGIILLQYVPVLGRRQLLSPGMFDVGFLRTAAAFSLPLMAAEISWFVLDSGDRFFIQHYLGAQALGFYAAAYGIAIYLQDVMMAPLQMALFPICRCSCVCGYRNFARCHRPACLAQIPASALTLAVFGDRAGALRCDHLLPTRSHDPQARHQDRRRHVLCRLPQRGFECNPASADWPGWRRDCDYCQLCRYRCLSGLPVIARVAVQA
jgi:hypothetical protein